MKNKGESNTVRVTLNEKLTEEFKVVKESTGMQNNRSVLEFLIRQKYHALQRRKYRRVFITNEDFDILEKAAAERGETVDEYIAGVTLERLEKVKEGVKHGN